MNITQRRHFIPILSVYFLLLPNTTAQQIGFYTALGYLGSFLLEIPSGYFADRFGHKKTMILSKILLFLSMNFFLLGSVGYAFPLFIIGTLCMNVGFAFMSGTGDAFMHNTLVALKKENIYTKIMSKINANAAFVSFFLLISLPWLTTIHITVPLLVNVVFDIIGILFVFSLISPPIKKQVHSDKVTVKSLIQKARGTGFFGFAIFIGLIAATTFAVAPFRAPYLVELGLPLVWMGLVMGGSRLVWSIVGHISHKIEELISIKKLALFEVFMFPLVYVAIGIISSPIIILILLSLMMGYFWGRKPIYIAYILRNFITNPDFKATTISIVNQIQMVIQMIIVFSIAFIMDYSFSIGFLTVGIGLFVLLIPSYIILRKIVSGQPHSA